ncbi:hypothetical protein SELMODRAFT_126235 [Selaginella moellendorffii]|uniref:NAB domain-containing protein n=1 Tax=Selaginella moellendorffii TaxID=88036 RepID=D8SW70_SELML|nr:hypothetical protein SELMODRAFT_126235 [Selaginella moellendorffii]
MGKSHTWWWDSHISPKNSKWLEDNLQGNLFKMNGQLRQLNTDNEQAKSELVTSKNESERLRVIWSQEKEELQERMGKVTSELEEVKRLKDEAQALLDENSQLHKTRELEMESLKHTRSRETFSLYKFLFGDDDDQPEERDVSHDEVAKKAIELQSKYSELKAREVSLKSDIIEGNIRIQQLEEEIATLKGEKELLDEDIEKEAKQTVDYERKLQELEATVKESEENCQKLTAEFQKVTEEHASVSANVQKLDAELAGLQKEHEQLQAEKKMAESDLENTKVALQASQLELEKRQRELEDDLSASNARLQEAMEEIGQLKQEKCDLHEEHQRSVENEAKKTADYDRKIQELEELASVQEENRMLKFELSKRDILIKRLEGDFIKLRDDKAEVTEQLKTATEQLNRMHAELLELREEDKRLRSKLESMAEKMKALQAERQRMSLANSQLSSKVVALEQENKLQSSEMAEEKRAAIRQLCFSLSCMREHNERLEHSLKNVRVRYRPKPPSPASTWKSFWNPWYNNNNNRNALTGATGSSSDTTPTAAANATTTAAA